MPLDLRSLSHGVLVILIALCGCDGLKFRGQKAGPPGEIATGSPPTVEPTYDAPAADAAANDQDELSEPIEDADLGFEEMGLADEDSASGFDFSFSTTSDSVASSFAYSGKRHPGLEKKEITRIVTELIHDSVDYGPTLVVWLLDTSPSALSFVADVGAQIRRPYRTLAPAVAEQKDAKLLTAAATFGGEVKFLVDPPSPNPASLGDALDGLSPDTSGRELTFTAVARALEKYLSYRTQQRREVLILIVTDEAGDDADQVQTLDDQPKRYGIPIYVVGVASPFGRRAALDDSIESSSAVAAGWKPIQQGPESFGPERLQLGFWGMTSGEELIDSGFGPFALERLCRGSGGRYLAWRPKGNNFSFAATAGWPSGSVLTFSPERMRGYAPDYVTANRYQALLEDNAARRALHEAAKIQGIKVLTYPQLEFEKRSAAELGGLLSVAQQAAARLEPPVNQLYETLERGEKARGDLTGRRWQAGYDLAMGRAAALKVRVDGYNAMLAALKRGKRFEQETSTHWVLQPDETIEASSVIRRLLDKATAYLERVVSEHPETPWAVLAQHELRRPLGWKWTER